MAAVIINQFAKLPYPTHKFTGKTVIVTGSNVGLGLEAARHFVRLDAAKVILAVRNTSKGLTAKQDIDATEKRPNVVEVWQLDLAQYSSVKAFAVKAQGLERIDVLVSNAGYWTEDFELVEKDETHSTINVVSTLLLAILLLPKMKETSVKFKTEVVSTFTGSFVHGFTTMPERKAPNIFDKLNDKKTARMADRYNVSKLLLLFCTTALASDLDKSSTEARVTVNNVNPGVVDTGIFDNLTFLRRMQYAPLKLIYRNREVGARTLVHGAVGGKETHGQYLSECKVAKPSPFVQSDEGLETQKRVWRELSEKLEKIQPGIMKNI